MRLTRVRTPGRRTLALVLGTATLWGTACGGGAASSPGAATQLPSTPTTSTAAPTTAPDAAPMIGPPTTLPWWSAGRLHVDGGVIRTTMRDIVTRGGTTIVGDTTPQRSSWQILQGDQLVPLASRHAATRPVISANGLHVAWVTSTLLQRFDRYQTEGAFTVTAYDVQRGAVTGTTVIRSRVSCCDAGGAIDVEGVDNDGTIVILRNADRAWAWRPDRALVRLGAGVLARGLPGTDQWPGGVSWTVGSSSSGPAAFARVSSVGLATRVGRVPVSQGGLWSPDGRSYAYQPFSKERRELPVVWSDGTRVRLHVPDVGRVVGWESARQVVLLMLGPHGHVRPVHLVRCNVTTGACERAGPPIPGAVLQGTYG